VMFQWLQTAISLRHADSIDVKFLLVDESGARTEKTVALPHPDVIRVAAEIGRAVDDAWCARLAELHVQRLVRSGEDMEKDLVTVPREDLGRYAAELACMERGETGAG